MKKIILISKISVKILFALSLITFLAAGCREKKGCTNPAAANFDKDAEEDDGSCIIRGCTDPMALNYNAAANSNDGSCQLAGTGGNTTIVAFPQHHGEPIFNFPNYRDTAYVKFNAQEFPGTSPSSYDAIFIGDHIGEDHVHLEELKPGKYFIYMVGFDTTINQRVTGGIPYILTQASGEVDLNVPVTE